MSMPIFHLLLHIVEIMALFSIKILNICGQCEYIIFLKSAGWYVLMFGFPYPQVPVCSTHHISLESLFIIFLCPFFMEIFLWCMILWFNLVFLAFPVLGTVSVFALLISFWLSDLWGQAFNATLWCISILAFQFPQVSPQWQPPKISGNHETWELGNLCPFSWKPHKMMMHGNLINLWKLTNRAKLIIYIHTYVTVTMYDKQMLAYNCKGNYKLDFSQN